MASEGRQAWQVRLPDQIALSMTIALQWHYGDSVLAAHAVLDNRRSCMYVCSGLCCRVTSGCNSPQTLLARLLNSVLNANLQPCPGHHLDCSAAARPSEGGGRQDWPGHPLKCCFAVPARGCPKDFANFCTISVGPECMHVRAGWLLCAQYMSALFKRQALDACKVCMMWGSIRWLL